MSGISPGREMATPEACGDPTTGQESSGRSSGCSELIFSAKSPDRHPIQETPGFVRRSSRRVKIAPMQLFSEGEASSPRSWMEASIELGVIPEVRVDADGNGELVASRTEMKHVECSGCLQLKQEYEFLFKEKVQVKRALKDVEMVIEEKSRQCDEALASLNKLQMELMQKSMHVGSLAFAVEGQVKEKTRWFLYLEDLSRKFKLLKMEHAKLSEEAMEYRRCLADLTQMTQTITSTLDFHVDLKRGYKDLKHKFIEEARERKELYNKLVEQKGNIRVFCRCRPLTFDEVAGGASMSVDFESAKDDEILVKHLGAPKKVFKFDAVFSPKENQETVFSRTSPYATSVLDGYNVCIFAYGQTGTGKTFTMEGTEEARGVNYRTLEELFRIIKERQGLYHYEITASVLEVYNEQIHDLLLPASHHGAAAKRLEVRQAAEGTHHVPGLVEAHVTNMNDAWKLLQTGSKTRAVGSTNANEHSSRSHCIHCVVVKGENMMNGECTKSKLWLVDLAGSERVTKTDAQGERLKEAQSINKSLSALGDVISALANKSTHIPFRNSKLTHLLQDSLGGDSKTLMFVQISPNESDAGETLCSLNFASRVRGIELGPAKKQMDGSEISRYKQMLEKAKLDSQNKDGQLKIFEETVHSLELKNKAKEMTNKNLQEKVKELESQLLIERKLARQHVDTKIAEHHLEQEQHRQQLKQQHQEPKTPVNPLPAARPLIERNHNPVTELPTFKELGKIMPPRIPADRRSTTSNILKENKPDITEDPVFARRDSRLPVTPAARRAGGTPASRGNSRIPLPNIPPPQTDTVDDLSLPSSSPPPDANIRNAFISGGGRPNNHGPPKKFASILRRSLQKKVIIRRSPLAQTVRKGGGGVESLRVSFTGSGRKVRRLQANEVPRAETGRGGPRQQKVKEKGWNNATTTKNF